MSAMRGKPIQPAESLTDSSPCAPPAAPTSNHGGTKWIELSVSGVAFGGDARGPPWRSFPSGTAELASPRTEHVAAKDLGDAGEHILRPIPAEIRRVRIGDLEASFREANIAMSGTESDDAYRALVAEIPGAFDVLIQEQRLAADAAEQIRTLRKFMTRPP